MLNLVGQFSQAGKAYTKAVVRDPSNYHAWFEYGAFYQTQNHFEQAHQGYAFALPLAVATNDAISTAGILHALGALAAAENNGPAAQSNLTLAISLNQTSIDELLKAQQQYALMQEEVTSLDVSSAGKAAIAWRAKLLEILPKLQELLEKTTNGLVGLNAEAKMSLGVARLEVLRHAKVKQPSAFLEARQPLAEALGTYQKLVKKYGKPWQDGLARAYTTLGVLNLVEGKLADARKSLEAALIIQKTLAAKNPALAKTRIANIFNNLGQVYSDEHRLPEARKAYTFALGSYTGLAEKNPDVWLPYVAAATANLALCDKAEGRVNETRLGLNKALVILRSFSQRNPSTYSGDIALLESHLAAL
jgi:hypothetical protein